MFQKSIMVKNQTPSKRQYMNLWQKSLLKMAFAVTPQPCETEIHELAVATGLTKDAVKIWFRNQRYEAKRLASKTTLPSVPYSFSPEIINIQCPQGEKSVQDSPSNLFQETLNWDDVHLQEVNDTHFVFHSK